MNLVGVDLNSTRLRAVHGNPGVATPLALEDERPELNLAISLEGRTALVGRAGTALERAKPHLACTDYLGHLGQRREWKAGRHRFDPAAALGLTLDQLRGTVGRTAGVTVTLPTYLDETQTATIAELARKARWPLLGTVPAPIAAALAGHERLPWSGSALVVDVDRHALTWSAVSLYADQVQLDQTRAVPGLGTRAWLNRLLDRVADRCVRLTRRDPRDCPEAEQSLFDQLTDGLEVLAHGGPLDLSIQSPHWFQHLSLRSAEVAHFCMPLLRQAVAELHAFLPLASARGTVTTILFTASAGCLPGLTAAVEDSLRLPVAPPAPANPDDFGEDLLLEENPSSARLHVLDPDAVARAAHELAARQQRGDLPRGSLDGVPLLASGSPQAGPARLLFENRDYFLSGKVFTLGRDPACDLVFASERYPTVSARHCEIVHDRFAYLLRDRSRHGTLVNDVLVSGQVALRSGDWIRMGPGGPLLRFLGQAADQLKVVTIA
jgi:hypothetical protein